MNFKVGQKIKIIDDKRKKKCGKRGVIDSIYEKFIIVKCKNYKECFLVKDINDGLIDVEIA